MSITPREPADFTPTRGSYTELKPFRFWCQKVLPLVYDDSLSYYELLCKVVDFLNKTMEDVETLNDDVTGLFNAYEELQSYVNDYFSTLDVQAEIDNKLDTMASDGSLSTLLAPFIPDLVSDWLEENISPTTPPIDKTLTIENAGADAKVVGEKITALTNALDMERNLSGTINGLVEPDTFIIGKTFDSNGIPVDSPNRAITDFIKCAGSSVLIVVPSDGSVKTNLYTYDSNKQFLVHGSYNNNTRIVYNQNAVYMRFVISYNDDSTADSNLINNIRIYNNIEKMIGNHKGNVVKLGYTSLAQCEDDGYYSFGLNDIPNISDLPVNIKSGGIVITFPYYAGGIPYQIIYAGNKMYYRYGVNPFVEFNKAELDAGLALSSVINGLVRPETFIIGKTFDSNGEPVDSPNRAITDFIKCAGSSVLIVVPSDGSVKTALYTYDANKQHLVHGSYNNTTRIAYNQNAVYMRFVISYSDDSTADSDLINNIRIYNNIEKMIGNHRGNVVKLGYTSLAQCEADGYYSFGLNDIPNISDLPYGIESGGIVVTFPYYAGGIPYQIIYASNKMYYRYGVNPFKPFDKNDYTDISTTWEKGAINQTTGENASSDFRIRTGNINVNEGVKITVPNEMEISIIAYNSNGERIYTTGLQQKDFYHYPQLGESYFRLYGGYIDRRTTITANDGKLYGVQYIPIASDAPMWYALGDSITQGFYSESGTVGIAGETPNGYPTYTALRNGWKLRNLGVGGSGYIKNSDSLNKPNAKGQVNNISFVNCDICTLAFGVNDWHYNQEIGSVNDSKDLGTTMASNMKYVIEKILTDNPLCRINIMLPLNCSAYGGTFESDWGLGTSLTTSGTLQHVIDVIKDVAEYYHLPVIDQSNTGIVNRFNINSVLPDGIHPAVETMKPYGERIARQIV